MEQDRQTLSTDSDSIPQGSQAPEVKETTAPTEPIEAAVTPEQPEPSSPAADTSAADDKPVESAESVEPAEQPKPARVDAAPSEGSAAETIAPESASTPTESSPDEGAAEVASTPSESDDKAKPGEDAKPGGAPAKGKAPRSPQVASLYRAFRSKRPVEGRIEKVIKGGYEVRVHKLRGFCPHSQLDLQRIADPEQQVGQSYLFRITQLRRGGDDVVLSRRALLEEERREEAKAVRATLIEGSVMRGRVAGLAPFGAFVDLGAGVLGLVHVSELSHARIVKVDEAVSEGDEVDVKVLKLHKSGDKISLSIRQAIADPWKSVAEKFVAGESYPGKVTRITDFGAFVEMAPGIEALAPGSEFPPVVGGWKSSLEAGAEASWQVLSVDGKRRRLSVTRPVEGAASEVAVEENAVLTGKVQRIEKFGVFVWLAPGKVGLMPNIWTGVPRGNDMGRNYPIGSDVEVKVVEIAEGGRRIRLAKNGVDTEPPVRERRPAKRSSERGPQTSEPVSDAAHGFGMSLADKLKAALGKDEN